ncbi:DUF2863 family protein [Castellaniella sp. GW247-6E4]|uniref:DUF2863 family protein n=1 Tax=Castellaniella sp. GW247-6E4 TaxID=3140380 RepID=UPI0033157779
MASTSRHTHLSRPSRSLIALADALARSGSRIEDEYWERQIGVLLDRALSGKPGRTVESALDHLMDAQSQAYEVLVEQAENRSESLRFTHQGQTWDALLFSAPILAWTRYKLPEGGLIASQTRELEALLADSIAAPGAHLALLPELVRFERLPQSFHETRAWTQSLALRALGSGQGAPVQGDAEQPDNLLADVLFLVGAIAVPEGEPLFRWQDARAERPGELREESSIRWGANCARLLDPAFTGCQVEYLQPEAYYTSTRLADQRIRPLSIKAAVTWLQTAGHIPAKDLRAAIVACGEQSIEEYRVGFCTRENNDVIYGCVWPALSREEASPEPGADGQVNTWEEIAALLREEGIQDVRRLPGVQALEFCDDCGTPYFPNMLGEMQHPELPEEIDPEPMHFH